MKYRIEPLNSADHENLRGSGAFVRQCGEINSATPRNVSAVYHDRSYLGAWHGDAFIGSLELFEHRFLRCGETVNCLQIGDITIASKTENAPLLAELIKAAQQRLIERETTLLIAFPYDESVVQLLEQAAFLGTHFRRVVIPSFRLLRHSRLHRWRDTETLITDSAYSQNDYELISRAISTEANPVLRVEDYHNFLWGRMRSRQLAIGRISYFDCGGMIINNPHLFHRLVDKLIELHRPWWIRIAMHPDCQYGGLFEQLSSGAGSEHFFVFSNSQAQFAGRFNLFAGVQHTF